MRMQKPTAGACHVDELSSRPHSSFFFSSLCHQTADIHGSFALIPIVGFQDVRRGRDGQGDGTSPPPCGAKSLNQETIHDLLTQFSLNKCLLIGYSGALL